MHIYKLIYQMLIYQYSLRALRCKGRFRLEMTLEAIDKNNQQE